MQQPQAIKWKHEPCCSQKCIKELVFLISPIKYPTLSSLNVSNFNSISSLTFDRSNMGGQRKKAKPKNKKK